MFRTPINIPPAQIKINHQTPILTLGSCFSDCMGSQFNLNKFNVLANPFGTVYNPLSIAKLLSFTKNNQLPDSNSYVESQGLHANFDFHSSFSSIDRQTIENRIKLAIEEAHKFLHNTQWLIITLGTAYVYETIDNSRVVSNCHKLPSRLFTKHLLSQKQILHDLSPTLEDLLNQFKQLNVILTVSPVRHIKDTLINNAVSKANLRVACHTLSESHQRISYFPSYEIMMDDLRDYRFYKEDMIHPTEVAEQYIWEKFVTTYFSKDTQALLKQWAKLQMAINHKPFNPTSDQHQKFLKQTIDQLMELKDKIDISEELTILEGQLIQ